MEKVIHAWYNTFIQAMRAISESCFDRDIFQSEYANLVIQYVMEKYQRGLEYLWERFPINAVWRQIDRSYEIAAKK